MECCLGLGGGGQKAEGNGAGAKELTLRRWTKNSLFPEECQVKSVSGADTSAAERQPHQHSHSNASRWLQRHRQAPIRTGRCKHVRDAVSQVDVNQGLVTPSRAFTATLQCTCATRTDLLRRLVCCAHCSSLRVGASRANGASASHLDPKSGSLLAATVLLQYCSEADQCA